MKELFIDGVVNAAFGGGAVRLDLGCAGEQPSGNGQAPVLEFRQRLVMTPQGFVRTMAAMEALGKKLVELGVLQAGDKGAESGQGQVTSINFDD